MVPGGKYCDSAEEEESRPCSLSWCVKSAGVTTPAFFLSRTANDSRIVCKFCGGIEERGSVEVPRFKAGFAVEEVGVRLYVGRVVDAAEGLSNVEAIVRLLVLDL